MTDRIDHLYFRQLDGLRCVSIVAVMLSHFAAASPVISSIPLGFGVSFFFVLSSFLITRILVMNRDAASQYQTSPAAAIRQFYIRRFLRIFPAYYLLIAVMYLLNWWPCRKEIVPLLTYTTNFRLAYGTNLGMFSHFWSLAVEEQVYIFFPLLIFITRRKYLTAVFIVLTFAGVIGRGVYFHIDPVYPPYTNFQLVSSFDSFGIGAILAILFIEKKAFLEKMLKHQFALYIVLILFTILTLISYTLPDASARFNYVSAVLLRFLFSIIAFWILGIAVTTGFQGIARKILQNKAVIYVGRISYGIYLYHLIVPEFASRVAAHLGLTGKLAVLGGKPFLSFLLYASGSVAVASVSWFAVEKPMNKLKRYFKYFSAGAGKFPVVTAGGKNYNA